MADFNSQLPVRTETDGDVVVKIVDTGGSNVAGVTASNEVQVLDSNSASMLTALQVIDNTVFVDDSAFTVASSSGNVIMGVATSDTVDAGDAGALAIDTSRNLKVSIEADNAGIGGGTQYTEDAVVPANPVGTAMMMERDDALAGLTPIEGDWTHPFATAEGALWVQDFNSDTFVTKLTDIETNTDFGAVTGGGVEASALRVTIASDSTGVLSVDDNGSSLTVDQSTHDSLNANANLQVADTDVSATNPVPVAIVGDVSTTEVIDYNTTASLSASGSTNHDYTITASTTLRVHGVYASGSGKIKVVVQGGPVAGLATYAVGFNSTSHPNTYIAFPKPLEVDDASTGTLRITITNRESSAQDVYSTLIAEEIPD